MPDRHFRLTVSGSAAVVTTVADPRTVPGIELVKVGTWHTMTGEWNVTADDLKSVVAAHHANVMRKPIIKLGHTDPRFDGEPSLGHIDNLRVVGDTLVGDLRGVPGWLADAMPTSYPDRSVEAVIDYQAADGTVYPLVLTGVALLGAVRPSVTSLASLQELVAASATGQRIVLARHDISHQRTALVAAARRRRHNRK